MKKTIFVVLLCIGIFLLSPRVLAANQTVIADEIGLLNTEQHEEIRSVMEELTSHDNVALVITRPGVLPVEYAAEEYLIQRFGRNSNAICLYMAIDEDYHGSVCVYAIGLPSQIITSGKANTIADNVYSYCADRRFREAAIEAFREIGILLKGGTIAEPMRYITAALLALSLAFFLMYCLILFSRRRKEAPASEIHRASDASAVAHPVQAAFLGSTRRYSPRDNGTHHGGGHSGGRSGGGGHIGSGGSHRF